MSYRKAILQKIEENKWSKVLFNESKKIEYVANVLNVVEIEQEAKKKKERSVMVFGLPTSTASYRNWNRTRTGLDWNISEHNQNIVWNRAEYNSNWNLHWMELEMKWKISRYYNQSIYIIKGCRLYFLFVLFIINKTFRKSKKFQFSRLYLSILFDADDSRGKKFWHFPISFPNPIVQHLKT